MIDIIYDNKQRNVIILLIKAGDKRRQLNNKTNRYQKGRGYKPFLLHQQAPLPFD